MAVRKTQKKHLGKKRKSLSKRKAHSKKKRHSKQRITKKRSHKGGGDDENTDEDGFTVGKEYTAYNPLTTEMVEEERQKAKEEKERKDSVYKIVTSLYGTTLYAGYGDPSKEERQKMYKIASAERLEREKKRKAKEKEEEERRKAKEEEEKKANLNRFSRRFTEEDIKNRLKNLNYELNNFGGKAHSKQRTTKKRYHKGGNMSKAKKIHNKKVYEKNKFLEELREFIETDNEELIKNEFNPKIKEDYFNYLKQRLLACINGEKIEGFYEGNWKEVDQVYVENLEDKIKTNPTNEKLKKKLLTCIKKATETKLDKFFDELIEITEKHNELEPLKTDLKNKIKEYDDDEEINNLGNELENIIKEYDDDEEINNLGNELKNIITPAKKVKNLQEGVQEYVLDKQEKKFEERYGI